MQTDCIPELFEFVSVEGRPVVAAFVDGGLNPRLSGAALKTGTKFAANSWRPECGAMDPCQRRKPPEAVAKGQFYRDLSPAKIGHRDRWRCSIACSPTQNIQRSGRQARRISADSHRRQQAFDGGSITSDAGAMLFGSTDRAIGLIDRFAACFRDARRQDQIEHEVKTLIGQRCSDWRSAMRTSTITMSSAMTR